MIITQTSIFNWLRDYLNIISPKFFGQLINCPRCLGFWVGLFIAFFMPIIFLPNFIISLIFHGALSSGTNWIIFNIIDLIEQKSTNINFQNQKIVMGDFENPEPEILKD